MAEPIQLTALVVDDDDTVMEHLTKLLRARGFAVAQEFDGMAALQRCRAEKFTVVLCDIRMPRLSGVSFLRNLRQSEMNQTPTITHATEDATSKQTVVMMSSLGDNATKRELLAAGTSLFLLKPVSGQALDLVLLNLNLSIGGKPA